MAKASKKLTAEFLKKKQKELTAREKHTIEVNGETYSVEIDKHFTKSKISDLSTDIGQFAIDLFSDDKYKDVDNTKINIMTQKYIFAMIIKYFTDIEIPNDTTDALLTVNVLDDLGLLKEVVSLMDEEEVEKAVADINERMSIATEELSKRIGELSIELEEIEKEELEEKNTEEAKEETK